MSNSILSRRGREAPRSPIRKLEPFAQKAVQRGRSDPVRLRRR